MNDSLKDNETFTELYEVYELQKELYENIKPKDDIDTRDTWKVEITNRLLESMAIVAEKITLAQIKFVKDLGE